MRLLFEMMRGEILTDGWRSTEVNEALDLCLACKGCKSDCPVSVDVATYKAEFLSHHYARRLRPRTHYSLGWLPLWARLASRVSWAANAATQTPGISRITKAIAGVDPQRQMPRFTKGFSRRFRRSNRNAGEPAVVLWPDTFSDNFAPDIPRSAVRVLEAAGFGVTIPPKAVCCGLTWISTGQLNIAQKVIARSLETLAPLLEAGLPVVGLEPSCTSVLGEDAVRLMDGTGNQRLIGLAHLLKEQTSTLAEFLDERAPDFAPQVAPDAATAIVQTHCHQHAVLGNTADTALMKRVGLDATVLKSGCCGLAGDFGMSPTHRDVSFACAERVLFPALRAADPHTQVLADGFSCRLQIAHSGTGKVAVHLAELLAAALPVDGS
jgi:Fe-S oxidoreductase